MRRVKKCGVRRAIVGALLLGVFVCFCSHALGASITTDTVAVYWYLPDLASWIDSGSLAVPGSVAVAGLTVGVGDGTLTVQTGPNDVAWNPGSGPNPWNGPVVYDLTQSPGFTSLSLLSITGRAPLSAGYVYPVCSFTADWLEINFNPTTAENYWATDFSSGWGLTYTFSFTYGPAVPLPPTVLLLGSGLMGLAGWRRFRKS